MMFESLTAFYADPTLPTPLALELRRRWPVPATRSALTMGSLRKISPEADYGLYWRDHRSWPTWRVSYVGNTGEIYAVQLQGDGRVEILGVVEPDCDPYAPDDGLYYRTLEGILDGWADECGREDSLDWCRVKLTEHRPAAPTSADEALAAWTRI